MLEGLAGRTEARDGRSAPVGTDEQAMLAVVRELVELRRWVRSAMAAVSKG